MLAPSLLWEECRTGDFTSECGRYRLLFCDNIHATEGLLCLVYFYGYLAHRDNGLERVGLMSRGNQWCVLHRAKTLPRIVEFEAWAAGRYGLDLRKCMGPLSRRDLIKSIIQERSEWRLGLPILKDVRTMTIGQTYQLLYESVEPEVA